MTFLPPTSDLALKEWAVAVKALIEGTTIMTVRKGGIDRADKEFRIVHPEFLLFPTYEHQKAELLKPEYQDDLRQTLEHDDVPGLVEISSWAQVSEKLELRNQGALDTLSPFHIWTSEYAAKRLHWRPKQPLTVALLRVYVMQQPQALPILDEYDGCKSWVELGQDVPLGYIEPVLSDSEYFTKVAEIKAAIAAQA